MSRTTDETAQTSPILRIAMTYPLGGRDGATLSFETFVNQDTPKRAIDELTDKCEEVATRQMLKGVLSAKEDQLDAAEDMLRNMARDYERVNELHQQAQERHLATRKGAFTIPEKETQNKKNVEISIEATKEKIERLKLDISELKAALQLSNGVAT